MNTESLKIEGLTPEEVLALPPDEMNELILCGKPIVFRAGSAEVLGQFEIRGDRLLAELGQIDGGGEGVLPTIWRTTHQYAEREGLEAVEWIVHAVDCAKPNLKLRRVLERRGFRIEQVVGAGAAYRFLDYTGGSSDEA